MKTGVIQNCGRNRAWVSAQGILDMGSKGILKKRNIADNSMEKELVNYISTLEKNPDYLPRKEMDKFFDELLAETAIEVSLKRHAGIITQEYDPVMGTVPGMPLGRDLRKVKHIIGVGGFLAHNEVNNAKK